MKLDDWFIFGLKAIGVIWVLSNTKRIFGLIRESFGVIDKNELAAMIFLPVLIWMLWEEKGRSNIEHQLFDDFKFGTVALIVMYGFGLKRLVNTILLLKGVKQPEDEKNNNRSADSGAPPDSDGTVPEKL